MGCAKKAKGADIPYTYHQPSRAEQRERIARGLSHLAKGNKGAAKDRKAILAAFDGGAEVSVTIEPFVALGRTMSKQKTTVRCYMDKSFYF